MRHSPYRRKADANHHEMLGMARAIGFSVCDMHKTPEGLDALVGIFGLDQRVEIKDEAKTPSKRKLTKEEAEIFAYWKGRKPVLWEGYQDIVDTRIKMLTESELLEMSELNC